MNTDKLIKKHKTLIDVESIVSRGNKLIERKNLILKSNAEKKEFFNIFEIRTIKNLSKDFLELGLNLKSEKDFYFLYPLRSTSKYLVTMYISFVIDGEWDKEIDCFVYDKVQIQLRFSDCKIKFDTLEELLKNERFISTIYKDYLIANGII